MSVCLFCRGASDAGGAMMLRRRGAAGPCRPGTRGGGLWPPALLLLLLGLVAAASAIVHEQTPRAVVAPGKARCCRGASRDFSPKKKKFAVVFGCGKVGWKTAAIHRSHDSSALAQQTTFLRFCGEALMNN